MIDVKIDADRLQQALLNLSNAAKNPRPVLKAIGEKMVSSTKRRFETSTGPDGQPWKANSPVTIGRFVHSKKGTKTKDGKFLTKLGEKRWDHKKPLVAGGTLMQQIESRLLSDNEVVIGSSMEYAAMQQNGGKKSDFPQLWGDVPARPFLGVSSDDEEQSLDMLRAFFESKF